MAVTVAMNLDLQYRFRLATIAGLGAALATSRTLVRHYWVPLGLTVLAVWAVIWLLLSLLG